MPRPSFIKLKVRDAYVHGERYLATHHVIEPTDDFLMMLRKKVGIQVRQLANTLHKDYIHESNLQDTVSQIAEACDAIVRSNMAETRRIGILRNSFFIIHLKLLGNQP